MSACDEHEELYGLTGLGRSLERTLATVVPTSEPLPAVELDAAAQARVRRRLDARRPGASRAARGRSPRELAGELGERWCAGPGAGVCDALRGRRPGVSQPVPERCLVPRRDAAHAGAGRRPRPRRAAGRAPPQGQHRVRERQPDGPAARRPRALRFDGRRALPALRLRRPRRDARVLRQRLRHADDQVRPVARRSLRAAPGCRDAGARRRLPGRLPARGRRPADRRGRRPLPRGGRGGRARGRRGCRPT